VASTVAGLDYRLVTTSGKVREYGQAVWRDDPD